MLDTCLYYTSLAEVCHCILKPFDDLNTRVKPKIILEFEKENERDTLRLTVYLPVSLDGTTYVKHILHTGCWVKMKKDKPFPTLEVLNGD